MATRNVPGFRFAIDRGGTFTDVYCWIPPQFRPSDGKSVVLKLLSEDPGNYPDAPREAIRRILEQFTGIPHPADIPVPSDNIESIRMGTTVATNALLERRGERCAFVTTRGFKDLLRIGNQSRPRIFDLVIERPELLYDETLEVDERVRILCDTASAGQDNEKIKQENLNIAQQLREAGHEIVRGATGELVVILKRPDEKVVEENLRSLFNRGIRSLAVSLAHSYAFKSHERIIGDIARRVGFTHVSLSSDLMAAVKLLPRSFTACADAYLSPVIDQYLKQFSRGFDKQLEQRVQLLFMQSDGGLAAIKDFCGFRAVLSGPAGGAVGFSQTTPIQVGQTKRFLDLGKTLPAQPAILGFDMGGTSTDVSRFAGRFDHIFEGVLAGVTIMAPALSIDTVAAGGGSKLFYRNRMFAVGPESAGANPGPACYRRGGPLTITDANLLLGRLLPEYFPPIFGPKRDEPLDRSATEKLFEELAAAIGKAEGRLFSPQQVALGFIEVANEAMCRPIRALTQARGFELTAHTLACFGGAGGQHCCAIARKLGLSSVFIHRFSGILSAFGMGMADVVREFQEPFAQFLGPTSWPAIEERARALTKSAIADFLLQGFSADQISVEVFLNLRYHGTDTAVMTSRENSAGEIPQQLENQRPEHYQAVFAKNYAREYGFTLDREVIVDDIRIRASGHAGRISEENIQTRAAAAKPLEPKKIVPVFFPSPDSGIGAFLDTAVFLLEDLLGGDVCQGPCMILNQTSTILIDPGCVAHVTAEGNIAVSINCSTAPALTASSAVTCDSVQLSVFSHRFMSIAEQMGRTLQRTAISTNIKERLDFSCALFGPEGNLVANAPHLPVHLGAMQEAVRFQIGHLGASWRDGDVILSNHPAAGGSHLPDITVITPVFAQVPGRSEAVPVFYVASRGHHADIGGITPGSMPPQSRALVEEGAAILSFKLVEGGKFNESGISDLLNSPGEFPVDSSANSLPIVGTRNLRDNLSDLKAQVAANQKGIQLVSELIQQYSLATVQNYMRFIQENAELAVREMLKEIAVSLSEEIYEEEYMDDGSKIALTLKINKNTGDALFDFTGTSPQVYGNFNAPRAVTYSAIIYCLRCLVKRDIPLNQGCLNSVEIRIPPGCLLNPSSEAAVVGGNVLTSQRVTDVVLKCFRCCGASQGCMNNLSFGDSGFGYYETIAGGAGAGPYWHGQSGSQTHMTNTRITDPEILERRYPVLLDEFAIRSGSGGSGRFRGGDGVIRQIQFLRTIDVNILSERRITRPYGMAGGGPGHCGVNFIIRKDGRVLNLGGKNSFRAQAGDKIRILTPGGGGYGEETEKAEEKQNSSNTKNPAEKTQEENISGSLGLWKATQEQA